MAPTGQKHLSRVSPGQVKFPSMKGKAPRQQREIQQFLFLTRSMFISLHGRMLMFLFTSREHADSFLQEFGVRYILDESGERGEYESLEDVLFERSDRLLMFWLPFEPENHPGSIIQLGKLNTSTVIEINANRI